MVDGLLVVPRQFVLSRRSCEGDVPRPEAVAVGLRSFRELVRLFTIVARGYPDLAFTELSMGMSNDYAIAVEEGSTMVRLGTRLFGARS